jgi:hypothetical protein
MELSDLSLQSDSENDGLNPEYASVFNVGAYFIDLGQFHVETTATGWALVSDPASQPQSVCITDESIFQSFTMNNAAEFEQRPYLEFVLLLKFPGKSQFLLYDVKKLELFTVRAGRLPHHTQQNSLQKLVDKCLRKMQYCISQNTCQLVNNFILVNKTVSILKSEHLTCKDFLSRSAYDGGKLSHSKSIVELKSTWIVDEKAQPELLYKSLFESSGFQLKTASRHLLDFTAVKSCEDITEGLSFVCPSKVPVNLAFRVLTQMHDRKWSLSPPTRERSQVVLSNLLCDIDSGIFYLVAKLHAETLTDVIQKVKSVLSSEIQKSQVPYVPSGRFHGMAQEKPTIEPAETGVFVKMPDPEHMTEVAKSWLWIKEIPPDFLTSVQTVMCDVAKEILGMSVLGSDQVSSNFLALKHSSIATNIPGGLLMVLSTFLMLSNTYPGLKLVVETYNNKSKGLISKVNVTTPLDFQSTAAELQRLMFEHNSIFRVISDFCTSCKAELDESASTISFGFRSIHKDSTTLKNVHTCVTKPYDFVRSEKCQIYPMAFMHPDICPFLYHPKQGGDIVRVQMYQEQWSAHKNVHPKQSRYAIGQNINKAMDGKLLNVSALRSGLNDLVESWDASFQHWHDTSGTRFEVACRPSLCRPSESSTMFDLQAGLSTVWQYLDASFSFSPIDAVTTYSSVCTAAILIGYRASLDALKDGSNLEANQQCQLLDYMRYLNAIIHTIPSGRFVSNNPKLFLANLGLDAGRCLALVPTLPLRVHQQIVSYLPGLNFSCEDPQLPEEHSRNAMIERIEKLKGSDSLEASMVLCSCGMGFFGLDRVPKLHTHLSQYPSHNSHKYKDQSITGEQWFATYVNQKQDLEKWLSNHGTIEQQSLFENVLNCKHTCSVGKAGTGKTFMMKKVDDFLSMIFLNRGEIVRIAPLGRVAQFFHCEARTVHSTMRLYMDVQTKTESEIVKYLEGIDSDVFKRMKVLIGLEMFVMCDCVLSGLLTYIRKHYPETLLLFEGDPIQLSVGKGDLSQPVLCNPTLDALFDTVVFDTQQRITNSEQKTALDKMRLGEADERVLSYWSSRVRATPDANCFTIYALRDKAENHNEIMLTHYENKWEIRRIQKIASDQFNGKEVSFPESVQRNCIVDKVLSIVPRAPVFFTRNINAMALCNSKEIYVGNGTPATVVRVEQSFIVVQLECGDEVKVEPIPIDIEDSEGYTRTQYPLILGWASTIHKVQGMQFAKVQIHFCFKGDNIKREASSAFYRGMAYMAFSRSEHITIIGQICLELLNNVNPYALQYWKRKVQEWSNRKSKDKKLVYRDAIHAQNNFFAQSFRDIRQLNQKNNRRESTTPLALNVSAAVPASTLARIAEVVTSAPALTSASAPAHAASASASASAPASASASVAVSALASVPKKIPALAPAIELPFQPAHESNYQQDNADIYIDDVLSSSSPVTNDRQPSSTSSPSSSGVSSRPPVPSLKRKADAGEVFHSKKKPSASLDTRPCNIVIPPRHNDSVLRAWKLKTYDIRLPLVSKLWTETFEEVFPKLGQKTFEEGIKFRQGSRGYGTATSNCCVFMLEVLKDLYPKEFRGKTLPCFVDIGSGIGNIILQMSALQPDFKCCLGIELETNRAAFAVEACRVFTEKASKNNIQFCQIEAREGNCFDDANCKQALMSASLVWINNEIFQPGDNLKLFKYLHSVVPVNCIIMSFVELLVTKRSSETTPQSDEPTDFLVHPPRQLQNASSWTQPNVFKKVFIIQRQTGKYLSAKNDDGFVSR